MKTIKEKENPAVQIARILLKQGESVDGRLSSCDIARACKLTNITIESLERKISKVEKSCRVTITPTYTRLGCNGGKTMIHLNVSVDDIVKLQKFTPTVSLKGIIAKEMGASVEEVKDILDPIPQKQEKEREINNDNRIKVFLEIGVSDFDRLIEAVQDFAKIDPVVLKIWERKKSLEEELKEINKGFAKLSL